MKQQTRWRALTLVLFAWFFVYKGTDGHNGNVSATPTVIGPFDTEAQCRTVREEMIGSSVLTLSEPGDVRFGSRYISQCWRSST